MIFHFDAADEYAQPKGLSGDHHSKEMENAAIHKADFFHF
jgi:hypothetical protein